MYGTSLFGYIARYDFFSLIFHESDISICLSFLGCMTFHLTKLFHFILTQTLTATHTLTLTANPAEVVMHISMIIITIVGNGIGFRYILRRVHLELAVWPKSLLLLLLVTCLKTKGREMNCPVPSFYILTSGAMCFARKKFEFGPKVFRLSKVHVLSQNIMGSYK